MEAADAVQSRQSILNPESQTLSKLPAKKHMIFKTILYSKPTPIQENVCEFLIFKSNAIRFHEI